MSDDSPEVQPIPPSDHLLVMEYETPPPVAQPASRSYMRVLLSLFDQGAVSIANFGTTMILSRAFGAGRKDELGMYYIAFMVTMLIGEAQNSLVTTAHMIQAPRLKGEELKRFNGSALLHQFWLSFVITFILVIAALLAFFKGNMQYASVLGACAVITVGVGLRNFGRIFSFATGNPLRAMILDSIATFVQLSLLVVMWKAGHINGWIAVAAVGIANAAAGIYWMITTRHEMSPITKQAVSDFKSNWAQTRWVCASGVLWNVGMSFYPSLIAFIRNAFEVATWGNCFQLAALSNPLLMGMQNWVAPSIARAYTDRSTRDFSRFVMGRALIFAASMIPSALVLGMTSSWLLPRMYKGELPEHSSIVGVLVFSCIFQAFNYTISRGLFSLNRADLDLRANIGPVIVLVSAGSVLIHRYGAMGAALSFVVSQMVGSVIRAIAFLKVTSEMGMAEVAS